jgi:hypothetical protein
LNDDLPIISLDQQRADRERIVNYQIVPVGQLKRFIGQ